MASNKMLIDASHPEETRVVVLRGNRIEEFDFESQNRQQLKGNIYLAKVTRVEPSLQAAFVDYGGNRHGFLAFNEIHPDYYQIPIADRQALLDEEAAEAKRDNAREDMEPEQLIQVVDEENADGDEDTSELKPKRRQRRPRRKSSTSKASADSESSQSAGSESENIENNGASDENGGAKTVTKSNSGDENSDGEVEQSTLSAEESSADESATTENEVSSVDEDISEEKTENGQIDFINERSGDENSDDKSAVGETEPEALTSKKKSKAVSKSVEKKDSPADGDISDSKDKPNSIAAMMETDSISEPAPGDESANGSDDMDENAIIDGDNEDPAAVKVPAKKRRRSTGRPRKKAKAEAESEVKDVVEAAAEIATESTTTAPEIESSIEAGEEENSAGEIETADGPVLEDTQSSKANEVADEAPKRKRRRSSRARKPADKADTKGTKKAASGKESNGSEIGGLDDNDVVETSGQEDALEEVPQRRIPRRQYKIQEVVKRRQVLLVQVVKEERGNKGAALTTYLSLAGRYSVLMPNTARGGGISRKITNAPDRKRLKAIATDLEVPEGMGVILRTAGASRTKAEIQRDFEYLMRLWENVRNLTLSSSAPCLVYEEGSLIKRSIRDLYDKDTGEVLVAGDEGHREAQEFMAMLMPNHAKKVKLYQDEQAMLARFGVEQQLDRMLSQQVTLKSGGYLVIDQTEALVAIDVNSGRATREHSIENTALQTNLETAEEVARQLRLRDLAGLIVIDFIDMEEKRNNRAVEKKLKECLKHDRARIQVGRISHFGLLEMSRQRMRASVLDSTMDSCPHCLGSGHIRSNSSVSLHILRSIEEHLLKNSRFDLVVKAASDIALYILNYKRSALMEIEERFGIKILIEGNRDLLGENFTMDKGEPSTGERKPVTHIQVGQMSEGIEDIEITVDETETEIEEEEPSRGKRRRRRGRNNKTETVEDTSQEASVEEAAKVNPDVGEEPGKRRRQRGKRAGRNSRKTAVAQDNAVEIPDTSAQSEASSDEVSASEIAHVSMNNEEGAATPARRSRNSRPKAAKSKAREPEAANDSPADPEITADTGSPASESETITSPNEPPRSKRRTTRRRGPSQTETAGADKKPDEVVESESSESDSQENQHDAQPVPIEEPDTDSNKRGGWWSRNGFFK